MFQCAGVSFLNISRWRSYDSADEVDTGNIVKRSEQAALGKGRNWTKAGKACKRRPFSLSKILHNSPVPYHLSITRLLDVTCYFTPGSYLEKYYPQREVSRSVQAYSERCATFFALISRHLMNPEPTQLTPFLSRSKDHRKLRKLPGSSKLCELCPSNSAPVYIARHGG